jgi:peroxiredoxin Q/BCP
MGMTAISGKVPQWKFFAIHILSEHWRRLAPELAKVRELPLEYVLMKLRTTSLLVVMFFSSLLSVFARSEPLKVGDDAPAVTGVTETGASLAFADVYKKQPYTLVYFYPKADTPGCTKQGCSLRDSYEKLTQKGVAVIGVSHDNIAAQKAFKDKYHLPFTLVAGDDNAVITAFGVPNIPATSLAKRQAYLIKDGKVVWADYSASTEKQAEDVLKVLDAQKS